MDAALIILDGWGIGNHDRRNAVRSADTPNVDRYREAGADGTLDASGRSVGLPEGGLGNSEVGHLTIGAGRIVEQAHTRINRSIADGSFYENEALTAGIQYADAHDGRLHCMGLLSDAGVHSDHEHLHALIGMAADRDVDAVTHAFTDGRDTEPAVAVEFLTDLADVIESAGTGAAATIAGRYYAMDRDQNWERTRNAYEAIVDREAEYEAKTAVAAVEAAYDRGETDEFIEPTLIEGRPALSDGDAVVTVNFRADRMRQLVRMLGSIRPEWDFETSPPEIRLVTMTEYDETFEFPVAFSAREPGETLGKVLSEAGKSQLRLAETEKYAHVTYFLNGGREVEFDGESRKIIESPSVPTYDEQPEMSAPEVTDAAIDLIERERPDALVLNYANPDMVGHTGDFEAAIAAVEAVDDQLGRLVPLLQDRGAHVVLLADHGNADDMGTTAEPHTAHTHNPVPFLYLAPDGTGGGMRVRSGGGLSDVAPTVLALMGSETPAEMTGTKLLE